MKAMRPLPTSYFSEYADEEIGVRDRSYATNWKDYGFTRFLDYLRVLERHTLPNQTVCSSVEVPMVVLFVN